MWKGSGRRAQEWGDRGRGRLVVTGRGVWPPNGVAVLDALEQKTRTWGTVVFWMEVGYRKRGHNKGERALSAVTIRGSQIETLGRPGHHRTVPRRKLSRWEGELSRSLTLYLYKGSVQSLSHA